MIHFTSGPNTENPLKRTRINSSDSSETARSNPDGPSTDPPPIGPPRTIFLPLSIPAKAQPQENPVVSGTLPASILPLSKARARMIIFAGMKPES